MQKILREADSAAESIQSDSSLGVLPRNKDDMDLAAYLGDNSLSLG